MPIFFQEGKRCPEQVLDISQIINENENFDNLIKKEKYYAKIPQLLIQKLVIVYSEDQLKFFDKEVLPNNIVQQYIKDGFILVPGPPKSMNLLDLIAMDPKSFYQPRNNWYTSEKFLLQENVYRKWLFVNKGDTYSKFTNKQYMKQVSLLEDNEYVPNVVSVVWFMMVCVYARIKIKKCMVPDFFIYRKKSLCKCYV